MSINWSIFSYFSAEFARILFVFDRWAKVVDELENVGIKFTAELATRFKRRIAASGDSRACGVVDMLEDEARVGVARALALFVCQR